MSFNPFRAIGEILGIDTAIESADNSRKRAAAEASNTSGLPIGAAGGGRRARQVNRPQQRPIHYPNPTPSTSSGSSSSGDTAYPRPDLSGTFIDPKTGQWGYRNNRGAVNWLQNMSGFQTAMNNFTSLQTPAHINQWVNRQASNTNLSQGQKDMVTLWHHDVFQTRVVPHFNAVWQSNQMRAQQQQAEEARKIRIAARMAEHEKKMQAWQQKEEIRKAHEALHGRMETNQFGQQIRVFPNGNRMVVREGYGESRVKEDRVQKQETFNREVYTPGLGPGQSENSVRTQNDIEQREMENTFEQDRAIAEQEAMRRAVEEIAMETAAERLREEEQYHEGEEEIIQPEWFEQNSDIDELISPEPTLEDEYVSADKEMEMPGGGSPDQSAQIQAGIDHWQQQVDEELRRFKNIERMFPGTDREQLEKVYQQNPAVKASIIKAGNDPWTQETPTYNFWRTQVMPKIDELEKWKEALQNLKDKLIPTAPGEMINDDDGDEYSWAVYGESQVDGSNPYMPKDDPPINQNNPGGKGAPPLELQGGPGRGLIDSSPGGREMTPEELEKEFGSNDEEDEYDRSMEHYDRVGNFDQYIWDDGTVGS